jgi:hypothetical protein
MMRSGTLAVLLLCFLSAALHAQAAWTTSLSVAPQAGTVVGTSYLSVSDAGRPASAVTTPSLPVPSPAVGIETAQPDADVAQPPARRTRAGRRAAGYCGDWRPERFQRNPSREEILCRHRVRGPGRFGLLSYMDMPVYQPATPMPGTHLAGVPGHTGPRPDETFEEWEWRVHRTEYPARMHVAQRSLDLLHPSVASRIIELERRLSREGIRFTRRETWRHPDRQAYLFQQGRSRPGPIATATLTSWHGLMDEQGRPAGRAVDYTVSHRQMPRFHEIARSVGLSSYGADSHDPGHVFLPMDEPLPAVEIQMLRLLPRVPEVTLATGLPVDRRLPAGGRARLRSNVTTWVDGPFVPYVIPRAAGLLSAPAIAPSEVPVPTLRTTIPANRSRFRIFGSR